MASIRERTSKAGVTTWSVLYKHEGKQSSTTYDTLKSAEKLRDLINVAGVQAALELTGEQRASAWTVEALAKEWLAYKARDMTTEGHKDYQRQVAKWILPSLGWRDAEMLTEVDVQRWVDTVLAPALGGKSVAGKHALLHGLYKWASAKTRGYVTHNPCKETELPERRKPRRRGLTIPELHTMLEAAERLGQPDAADAIAVMAGTGWRPAEVLGLGVDYVEVTGRGVWVTMGQVYRRGEGIVEDGKTDAAERRIRVLGSGAAALARRVVGRSGSALVFPSPVTGLPWNPTAFRRSYWGPIVQAAGLAGRGPTPYWLRHTHVMLCVVAGLTLPEIQRRIGHESIQTTIDVYGRMIEGMSDESAAKLDALLTPGSVPQIVQGDVV